MIAKAPNKVELSVIIVSYNTCMLLRNCLRSIQRMEAEAALEIIVIDNASHDDSADMVAREFPRVTLIKNPENAGFATANNQGLRVACGEALLLLNSDTEVRPGALIHCLDFLRAHSEAGIVGCKLLNRDGSVQPSCESFLSLANLFFENFFLEKIFLRSRWFGRRVLSSFGYDRVLLVDYVKGAFLMIRRRAFEDVGLLDERFFFYAEEMDWCYRAHQKGWQVYFTPGGEVLHYGGQSSDPISPATFVQLHRARYQFYRKYHRFFLSFLARLLMACGAILRALIWALVVAYRSVFDRVRVHEARNRLAAFSAAASWLFLFRK